MKKLFYNGNFYSMKEENHFYKAVLTENGYIKEVFESVPKIDDAKYIDLNGLAIYPGFTDAHTHSFEGGLYQLGGNLQNVQSLQDVLDLLKSLSPISGCIFAYNFDENKIKEKRFPTIEELDQLFPETPLLLRRIDGHSCVINSAALINIPFLEKLPKDFNGLLRGENNDIAAHWFHKNLDEEGLISAYKMAEKTAIRGGFTTIHTMIGDAQYDSLHYRFIRDNLNKFKIDYILYPQILDVKQALDLGAERIGGCILADGSFGSYTAALTHPYENSDKMGILYQTDKFWEEFVWEAHQNNLQIGVHCIGDRAIKQILNAYEKAQIKAPKDLRHQIIHNELNNDEIISTIKRTHSSAVMQPVFDELWGGENQFYHKVLGYDRMMNTTRLKSIYENDILLAGSSDWYITDLDIVRELSACINIHNKNERLSYFEALKIYTINSAKLSHDEDIKGCIDIGYKADFTVLNQAFDVNVNLDTLRVNSIYKAGTKIS